MGWKITSSKADCGSIFEGKEENYEKEELETWMTITVSFGKQVMHKQHHQE